MKINITWWRRHPYSWLKIFTRALPLAFNSRRNTMAPVLRKFPTSFPLLVKNFCFSLVFWENFQFLTTFNEVSESVHGLQIRVNLANPIIKNSLVIIFYSNSSNLWRIIFQNPKTFQNIIFRSKVIAIWNLCGFLLFLGHSLIQFKLSMLILQLTYLEFPFESQAKGDNLIGVHQTKTVKNWKVLQF